MTIELVGIIAVVGTWLIAGICVGVLKIIEHYKN